MNIKPGDVVQITNPEHPWFPALLVVSEIKSFGVQGYAIAPIDNDPNVPNGQSYNRLKAADYVYVGEATIITEGVELERMLDD